MVYKWCVVPLCKSTTIKNPNKLFVSVPMKAKRRKLWLQLAGRHANSIGMNSSVHMCEDHFNMEKDIENFLKYKMGFSQKLLVREEAVPTKFSCQDNWKSQCISSTSSPVPRKKQRKQLVPACFEMRPKHDLMVEILIEPKEEMMEEYLEEDIVTDSSECGAESEDVLNTDAMPNSLLVCRGCLATDRKLFHIEASDLKVEFEEIIGNTIMDEFANYMCSWCATLLSKFKQFRDKCRYADELLQKWHNEHTLTTELAESAHRSLYNMNLNLEKATFVTVSSDYMETTSVKKEIELKNETEMEEGEGDNDIVYQNFDERNNVHNIIKCSETSLKDRNHKILNGGYENSNALDSSDTESANFSDREHIIDSVNENDVTMEFSKPEIIVNNDLKDIEAALIKEVDPLDVIYVEIDKDNDSRKKIKLKRNFSIANKYTVDLNDLLDKQQPLDKNPRKLSKDYSKFKPRILRNRKATISSATNAKGISRVQLSST